MTAYLVFVRQRITDDAEMEKARTLGHEAAKHAKGMDVIAPMGLTELLEGGPMLGAAIARFDSVEAAKAFYDGPAYKEATKHRLTGADYLTFIVEGP